jgi:hypothetical protein
VVGRGGARAQLEEEEEEEAGGGFWNGLNSFNMKLPGRGGGVGGGGKWQVRREGGRAGEGADSLLLTKCTVPTLYPSRLFAHNPNTQPPSPTAPPADMPELPKMELPPMPELPLAVRAPEVPECRQQ